MKLADMEVKEFMRVLASDASAPGGGSAAALSGAQGCALTAMVCELTIGKPKYAEHEALIKEVSQKMLALKDKFLFDMDKDTETFSVMTDVFAMPKNTDEEKAARKAAMQNALKVCTEVPRELMELSLEALEETAKIIGKSNTSAASDLGVAALSLKTAVQGAWLNVLINIGGIKDEAFVAENTKAGQDILAKALPLADKIYEDIKATL